MLDETLAMNESGCADVSYGARASASSRAETSCEAEAFLEDGRLFFAGPRLSRVPAVFFAWLVGFFTLWSLRATLLFDAVDAHIGPIPRALQSHALSFFVWVLPALFVGRQIFGSRFATILRVAPPSMGAESPLDGSSTQSSIDRMGPFARSVGFLARRRTWILAAVAIGLWFTGVVAFEHVTSGRHLSFDDASLLRLVASLSLVPIGEEIVFRGLILSVIERRLCLYRANLLTSLLFVAIHLPYWISSSMGRSGAVDEVALRSLQIFVLSIFLGALTIRTRSIWPAVVAHMINNAIAVLLV